jgi:hypothetical protein
VKAHDRDALWGVTLYYFLGVCMFECVPPQSLKEFQDIFAYYVRIQLKQGIKKETISFHFIKQEIGIYSWKQM